MNRAVLLEAAAATALLVCTLIFAESRVRSAERTVDAAAADLARLAQDAERLLQLRARPQIVASQRIPETTIVESINRCLQRSGISADQLGSVSPAGTRDSDIRGERSESSPRERLVHRTQGMRVSVTDLTPEEVGKFLAAWSEEEPLWRIVRIALSHAGRGAGTSASRGGAAGTTLGRYDLTLEMTTTYATYSAAES